MNTLADMTLFVEVAKTQSFSRAAEHLAMPQSTLSRRISELEKALGLRLFNRTTRRTTLTEAGRLYFERARPLVEEARHIHDELHGKFKQPQGVLRVSLPVDFAYEWLAPLLPEFAAAYPDIRLEMDVTPRRADLIAEPFDLVIRAGIQPDSAYIATLLMRVPRYLYVSADYLAKHGTPEAPEDLNAHRLLAFPKADWQLFDKQGTATVITPQAAYIANSVGLLARLAAQGMGISLLPERGALTGVLQRILPNWQAEPVPIYALTATRLLPVKSRCFIEFLKERAEHGADRAES